MKKQQLMIVLICVLVSLILMTVFSKIQKNRIHHLRQTLDSLENGKQEQIDEKFFSPESSNP